jgi:hypothetical protein
MLTHDSTTHHKEELKRLQQQLSCHSNTPDQCFETALALQNAVLAALLCEAEFSEEDITGMVTALSLSKLYLKMGHSLYCLELKSQSKPTEQ